MTTATKTLLALIVASSTALAGAVVPTDFEAEDARDEGRSGPPVGLICIGIFLVGYAIHEVVDHARARRRGAKPYPRNTPNNDNTDDIPL